MRKFTIFALLGLGLLAGCGENHHLYPGPQRSAGVLARVECYRLGTDVRLISVNGQDAPGNYVFLPPGEHHLVIEGPTHIASKQDDVEELTADREEMRPRVELHLELKAGQHYFLGASYKDLAFLKVRTDQSRVWDEGFYESWTLDIYERAQSESRLPDLIRRIVFEAE